MWLLNCIKFKLNLSQNLVWQTPTPFQGPFVKKKEGKRFSQYLSIGKNRLFFKLSLFNDSSFQMNIANLLARHGLGLYLIYIYICIMYIITLKLKSSIFSCCAPSSGGTLCPGSVSPRIRCGGFTLSSLSLCSLCVYISGMGR